VPEQQRRTQQIAETRHHPPRRRAFVQAAEAEKEPERKQRLRAVADGLGGALRDIAVGVITKRLGETLAHLLPLARNVVRERSARRPAL
jgi:hypothetical protein